MDKEKEIEELAEVVTEGQIHLPDNYGMTYSRPLAKWIIDAGYRKSDDVRKETIREILYAVDDEARGTTSEVTRVLRRRYGVEVEE